MVYFPINVQLFLLVSSRQPTRYILQPFQNNLNILQTKMLAMRQTYTCLTLVLSVFQQL